MSNMVKFPDNQVKEKYRGNMLRLDLWLKLMSKARKKYLKELLLPEFYKKHYN